MSERAAGDQVRVTVHVDVEPEVAFQIFTEEIDQWWRRGLKFRTSGDTPGVMQIEPRVGGRLFETIDTDSGPRDMETGRVTAWEPPLRLVFDWRGVNFSTAEKTEVEVVFTPVRRGTSVTVTHRGWSQLRPDHPARHGLATKEFCHMACNVVVRSHDVSP